jgi:hypothetical protein
MKRREKEKGKDTLFEWNSGACVPLSHPIMDVCRIQLKYTKMTELVFSII